MEGGQGGARGAAAEAGGVPLRAAAIRRRDAAVHGLAPARRRAADHRAPPARVGVLQPAAVRAAPRRHGRRQLYRRGQSFPPLYTFAGRVSILFVGLAVLCKRLALLIINCIGLDFVCKCAMLLHMC